MKTITKVALSTMTLVAVAAGSVAGTLAYLKAETPTAVNAQTVGNVKIEQIEQQRVDDDANQNKLEAYVPFAALNPCYYEGSSIPWAPEDEWVIPSNQAWKVVEDTEGVIDKFVSVKNTGENAAYVRTIIAVEVGKDGVNDPYCHIVHNTTNIQQGATWELKWLTEATKPVQIGDAYYALGVYTYTEALPAGETTIPNLKQIYLDKTATNEVMEAYGDTFNILVMTQAVQAQMNGLTPEEALNEAFTEITTANHPWSDIVSVSTADELAAAVANGGTVVVSKDINLADTQIKVTKDTTIILAGDIIGEYAGADHYAMFTVANNATLTVEGSGNVKATTETSENNRSLAIFQNSGDLIINGGTYEINDNTVDKTWIIATIVDNRTNSMDCTTSLTINGGDFTVSGKSINLFRNYPQQGGTATLTVNDGTFHENAGKTTYFWNQESGSYVGAMNFNGGVYDGDIVYEDYNGQDDIYVSAAAIAGGLKPYSGNS